MKKDDFRCPGQNTMFWKPDDIYDVTCPNCGRQVEFWKDDARRTCVCGHRFMNPRRDLGCLEWCKYAEKCMPEMFTGENLQALYRDRLLAAVKITLKPDEQRLQKTSEAVDLAEEILAGEGGEAKVVIAGTILRDLLAAAGGGNSTPEGISREDVHRTAVKVLSEVNTEDEVVEQVSDILQSPVLPEESASVSLKVVLDALYITELRRKRALLEETTLRRLIDKKILTDTGKQVAKEWLLKYR
ncbi:MAG: hypothetical protein JRJ12_16095 [Deltaproteobacteria bacterium]|nr:hypothetical protein [Deltaproteobacteria bacterium]MBW2072758.1 hypothetical protein [Deltaproteobacteria bacterium]